MTTPLGRLDLLAGYALAFGALAAIQGALTAGVAFGLLDLDVAGSPALVVGLAVASALLGMSLGLFVSAFAATEFQVVQFMPAAILPQVLLCGLFVPRDQMARPPEPLSDVLPMSYAYDAMARVAASAEIDAALGRDVAVVLGVTLLALALGAATLRRRTPLTNASRRPLVGIRTSDRLVASPPRPHRRPVGTLAAGDLASVGAQSHKRQGGRG